MLSNEEIDDRTRHGLYRPLNVIAAHQATISGITFGLENIDRLTGGLRPRRLNIVGAYAHNGKTALMLTAVVRNMHNLPCLYVSGDDTDDMVLSKVIAMDSGLTTDDVESAGPVWRTGYVAEHLAGRLVIAATKDDYSVDELMWLYDLAAQELGQAPALVCFDYVSLLRLQGEGVSTFQDIRAKYRSLKKLIRTTPDSVWLVAQQCIKSAEDTPALTMNHLEYGGHQDADGVIIGCRRRSLATMKDDELWEEEHMPRVHLSVMKNKVSGHKSSNPVGRPYLLDPSGIIREILDSDRPMRPGQRPAQVLKLPSLSIIKGDL